MKESPPPFEQRSGSDALSLTAHATKLRKQNCVVQVGEGLRVFLILFFLVAKLSIN
jgi:hypothetical protein